LIHRTIKKLRFKVEKKDCEKLIKENEEIYENFITLFLNMQNEKNSNSYSEHSEEEVMNEPQKVEVVRVICRPMPVTKVELVTSTSG
jgi:hypothetical protein